MGGTHEAESRAIWIVKVFFKLWQDLETCYPSEDVSWDPGGRGEGKADEPLMTEES